METGVETRNGQHAETSSPEPGIIPLEDLKPKRLVENWLQESLISRLSLEESCSASGTVRIQGEAVEEPKGNTARDTGKGAVASLNCFREGEEETRRRQPSCRDLQLTMNMGNAVEDDAQAVAKCLTTLLTCLKSALSEVTGSSVQHMKCENQAAGQVQDAAIDAAMKGNRFINACLRLNEEMKGMDQIASQIENLKQRVDYFEYQASRYLPRR